MIGLWGTPTKPPGPRSRKTRKPPVSESESGTDSASDDEDGRRASPSSTGWTLFGRRADSSVSLDSESDEEDDEENDADESSGSSSDEESDRQSTGTSDSEEDEEVAVTRSWFRRGAVLASPLAIDDNDDSNDDDEEDERPSENELSEDGSSSQSDGPDENSTPPGSRFAGWFRRGVQSERAEADHSESEDDSRQSSEYSSDEENRAAAPRLPTFGLGNWFDRGGNTRTVSTDDDSSETDDESDSDGGHNGNYSSAGPSSDTDDVQSSGGLSSDIDELSLYDSEDGSSTE